MECGLGFWLKASFIIYIYTTKIFFEIPPCAEKVIIVTEFVILCKNPPLYEVNQIVQKWLAHGEIPKIFFLDHFFPSILGQQW